MEQTRVVSTARNANRVSHYGAFDESTSALLDTSETTLGTAQLPSNRGRWRSVIVSIVITSLIMAQSRMFSTNLWPYMNEIDPSTTQTFYGFTLMMAGICLALASPFFGWLTNKAHQCKQPLMLGITLLLISNLLTAFAGSFPRDRRYVLVAGRILNGIGCGSYTPLLTYAVMATEPDERGKVAGIRTALNTVSMFIGAGITSACVPLGYPGLILGDWFHFDMYSGSAWGNVFIVAVLYLAVGFGFKEFWISIDPNVVIKSNDFELSSKHNGKKTAEKELVSYDKVCMVVCWGLRFVFLFMINIDAVIGTAFMMIMFKWSPEEVILYNNIINVSIGVLSILVSLALGNIVLKYVNERGMILFGLFIGLSYFAFTYSWPTLPLLGLDFANESIFHGNYDVQHTVNFSDLSSTSPISTISSLNTYVLEADLTKCTYSWCGYTTRVHLWQYIVARVCMAVSNTVGLTSATALMCKVLGPRPQGVAQGLFSASGTMGAILSSIISGATFEYLGPSVTFGIGASVVVCVIAVVISTYSRLVGWEARREKIRMK